MRVVVVGGGVAGTVSAIALRHLGAEVTVYEAYADPAGQIGSFVSLAGNGLRGLAALGCLDQVQQLGIDVPRQRMWSSSGRLLGDMPRGRKSEDTLHSVTVMRGHLVESLRAAALRVGADIVTGQHLVNAVTTPDGVQVEFGSGLTAEADLLIGADGIWSVTREILDPAAPRPVYAGLYHISGVATGIRADPGIFNMVFARNGAFIHLPAADGTTWWSAQVASPVRPDLSAVDLDLLTGLFRHEEMPCAILRATTKASRPTLDHVLAEVPVWHNDRIVLLGDAGHPVGAGQGASMAIEDGVVLAQHLASATSIRTALAGYDRARRTRIAKMVKAAGHNRDAKTAGPIGRRFNDLIMPVFFRHFLGPATAWLYTHDLGQLPTGRPLTPDEARH